MENKTNESLLINNILCFVSTARQSTSCNEIVQICLAFYKEKEILDAKKLICDFIGEKIKYRRGENRMLYELKDLVELFARCDDDEIPLPKFVCDSHDGMPPASGFSIVANAITTLMEEISTLKTELNHMKDQRLLDGLYNSDITRIKEDLLIIKGEVRKMNHKQMEMDLKRQSIILQSMDPPTTMPTENMSDHEATENFLTNFEKLCNTPVRLDTLVCGEDASHTPSAPPASQEPWAFLEGQPQGLGGVPPAPLYSNVTSQKVSSTAGETSGGPPSPKQKCGSVSKRVSTKFVQNGNKMKISESSVEDISNTIRNVNENIRNDIDSDGFKLVQNNKNKKKYRNQKIVGTKKNNNETALKSATKYADIFVGNCALDVTEKSLMDYIKEEMNIKVKNCELLVTRNENCKCFKVNLNMNDRQMLLSSDVWPENIICNKYYKPKNLNRQ